jgi:uncharacterized cupin superfamily protein
MKEIKKSWGKEIWYVNNELYCCKFLHLNEGKNCSIHYHKLKDEEFYVLEGIIKLELFGETKTLKKGDSIRLKPYTLHRFTGIKDSVILEVSTHHEDSDSYRVSQDNENLISYKEASDAILMAVGHSKTLKSLA